MTATTSQRELHELLLDILPDQGHWSEEEYLWLAQHSHRLIELINGYIEVLPMATDDHQGIVGFFYSALLQVLAPLGGVVRFAPLPLRLRDGRIREPDLMVLLDARDPRRQNHVWHWADLVMEIVSPDKPARDLVEKRGEYAAAGFPEYWIVNPLNETIIVLRLAGAGYTEHGVFARGARATSVLLAGFAVDVGAVFDAI